MHTKSRYRQKTCWVNSFQYTGQTFNRFFRSKPSSPSPPLQKNRKPHSGEIPVPPLTPIDVFIHFQFHHFPIVTTRPILLLQRLSPSQVWSCSHTCSLNTMSLLPHLLHSESQVNRRIPSEGVFHMSSDDNLSSAHLAIRLALARVF